MDRTAIGVSLLVVAVLGVATLATTIPNHGGDVWGPSGTEGCQVDHPTDCSVGGEIRTADGDPVSSNLTVHIYFGPDESLFGNLRVGDRDGDGNHQVFVPDTVDRLTSETVVLEPGDDSTNYGTDSVEGGVRYPVYVDVDSANWTVEPVVPGGDGGQATDGGDRDPDVTLATVFFESGPERQTQHFELSRGAEERTRSTRVLGVPTSTFVGYIALLAAAVVLLGLFYLGSQASVTVSDRSEDAAETDREALARIAGDAADAIEHEDAHANAVYRAWDQMTAALDVTDPETTTPGEFAGAATAAGLDEDDVAELTDLFREVRYGGADPELHEERALDTLRRVEEAYPADEETEGSPDSSSGGGDGR